MMYYEADCGCWQLRLKSCWGAPATVWNIPESSCSKCKETRTCSPQQLSNSDLRKKTLVI